MYGLVNNSIKDLIILNYGTDKWEIVLESSNIDVDYFLNTHSYSDKVTLALINSASTILNIEVNDFLFQLGEFWILQTAEKYYGTMLKTLGDNPRDFFNNLIFFHNRVEIIYPNLKPPYFSISNENENSICLSYYSTRTGLKFFMMGLISGVGKRLNYHFFIEEIFIENNTHNFSEIINSSFSFKITWN